MPTIEPALGAESSTRRKMRDADRKATIDGERGRPG
jgi:hypothetical protein